MDNQIEVREFLRTQRGRIGPTQAGLVTGARHRRVPGLRREEVALPAGISIDYYARMERGNLLIPTPLTEGSYTDEKSKHAGDRREFQARRDRTIAA
ncbi:hypothetical protein RW1_012_01250 [Rhodococcus wratislaviensis NBRC 100605]|uniref:Transcriptional regulator n=1 Tax=Rhodococcus wratislaviensis NBRC 100605 TaxID=1219028 RepID=X0Q1Z8_RHOWR|nr:hypothetical protein RW1_012_01250 [Rhodococcus wratislaviensis NBRC 100605]